MAILILVLLGFLLFLALGLVSIDQYNSFGSDRIIKIIFLLNNHLLFLDFFGLV